MNRTQYRLMAKDVKANPANLAKYRKIFKYAYPFGDKVFKRLMINQMNPERFIAFLNAMMGLEGPNRIKEFTFRIQEIPTLPTQKKPIFDIVGTNQAGEPVLVEVQQNASQIFIDRLFYYVSRTVSVLVPEARHERSGRAEMLRFLIDLMEEKPFSDDILQNKMYAKFVKDVSLEKIEDELLLREVGDMTDIKYEKESSYLDGIRDTAKRMIADGKLSNEEIASYSGLSIEDVVVLRSQAET